MDPKNAVTRLTDGLEDLTPDLQVPVGSGYDETIEERCFSAALICLEGHYTQSPPMGPLTTAKVQGMIAKTLEKTHTFRKAREALARNVAIWIWLTRIFAAAIPSLTTRSVGPLSSLNDPEKGVSPSESTTLIVNNHHSIKEDLGTLIKLMHIARNLLVNAEPEVPQDICAAVHFDQMVYQTIILCVNVTSKGYDGEILDEASRAKLSEVTELFKKLLVTSLQQAHNWTAKHDRNKMSFWFDVLFDDEGAYAASEDLLSEGPPFRPDVAKQQVQHWLDRNSRMCETARKLLRDYALNRANRPPGNLAPIRPLAWNWLPEGMVPGVIEKSENMGDKVNPVWNPEETDKFEQDRIYGRVSREIDTWWLRARDPNYDGYVMEMPDVNQAKAKLEWCKQNLTDRYAASYRAEHSPPPAVTEEELSEHGECANCHGCDHVTDDNEYEHEHDEYVDDDDIAEHEEGCVHHIHDHHHHDYAHEYMEDMIDEEDADDDESYGDGPLTGLLTEIPNILDPKQIEALHMIVKSCILDNAGSGLTKAGENLQKTRCRMFLALDCGKSLLREMLVFVAVWEKDESSLIFQVTTQIVEALHHSALIPYAWNCLRIPKDTISPAQSVLLRMIDHMFRARATSQAAQGPKDKDSKDIKLVHFLFSIFRTRIVPDCVALIELQQRIRHGQVDAAEFPVDTWDIGRVRDGLAMYLDLLTTVAEMSDTREMLIEWDVTYDILALLNSLEGAIPKKPLVELPKKAGSQEGEAPRVERPFATDTGCRSPSPPSPYLQEPAHKFPWGNVKCQIFAILATLLQPPPGQSSPGNPEVQRQIVRWNGIVALLNSCAYDDHNPFAKERVTICLKWLLDGCEPANAFFRELVHLTPEPDLKPPPGGTTVSTIRVDGILGEVKVQVRSNSAAPVLESDAAQEADRLVKRTAGLSIGQSNKSGNIEEDFMA